MSVFKDFWDYVRGKMTGREEYTISTEDFSNILKSGELGQLAVYEFAIQAGINIIANALSMCEVRTFKNWKEIREDEYFQWNYQPNQNQNASEFMHQLVWNLIYKNECLVVETRKGDLLIADDYTHECFALKQDTFRDVKVCSYDERGIANSYTFREQFKMGDVLFYRLNNQNIAKLLEDIVNGYENLLNTATEKFFRAAGEHGILTIDGNAPTFTYGIKTDGTPRTFNDVYGEMMLKQFSAYFKNPTAVLTLWKGFSYDQKLSEGAQKRISELDDITKITDEIFERVANALQIPVSILKGDIANVAELTKNLLTFAIDPIAEMIQTENNRKRSGKAVCRGTYQMIDTSRIMHMSMAEIATSADKMIGSGLWSIDDALRRIGDAPLNTEWSTKHWMTKNYTEMDALGEDGTENEDNRGRDSPDEKTTMIPERRVEEDE